MSCSICSIPWNIRQQVDKKLQDGIADNVIARDYNLDRSSIGRHRRAGHHLDDFLNEPPPMPPESQSTVSLGDIEDLLDSGQAMNPESVLAVIDRNLLELHVLVSNPDSAKREKLDNRKELRAWTELRSKIMGMLQAGNQGQAKRQLKGYVDEISRDLEQALENVCDNCRAIITKALREADDRVEAISTEDDV